MQWDHIYTLALAVLAVGLLAFEKAHLTVIGIGLIVAVTIVPLGLPVNDAIAGFSNPAVVTVAEDLPNVGNWPNVYDMRTVVDPQPPVVGPFGPTDDVLDGLIERIGVHLCENPAALGCLTGTLPDSPTIEVCFELLVGPVTAGFTEVSAFEGTTLAAIAQVPTYYHDAAAPLADQNFQIIGGTKIIVGQATPAQVVAGAILRIDEDTVIGFFDPIDGITEVLFQYLSDVIPPTQSAQTSFRVQRVHYTLPVGLSAASNALLNACMQQQNVDREADLPLIGDQIAVNRVLGAPVDQGSVGCAEILEPGFLPYLLGPCDPLSPAFPLGLFSKPIDSVEGDCSDDPQSTP